MFKLNQCIYLNLYYKYINLKTKNKNQRKTKTKEKQKPNKNQIKKGITHHLWSFTTLNGNPS